MDSNDVVEERLPHDECGAEQARVLYADGHWYCYKCDTYGREKGEYPMSQQQSAPIKGVINNVLSQGQSEALTKRNISLDTVKKYGVTSKLNKHIYPYFDKDGKHVANKVRAVKDKAFYWEGSPSKAGLFGQHLYKPNGKYITVTEGELDCLAAYQLMGSKWPVVSVKDGAQSALKSCKAAYQFLDSFDSIVVSFDSDQQGKDAALAVANLFGAKVRIMKHRQAMKDACDYLNGDMQQEYVNDWWASIPYTPDDLVNGYDLLARIKARKHVKCLPSPWKGYDQLTYGFRLGEMVTLTGGAGMGKTTILRELEYHFLNTTDYNIGALFLEETAEVAAEGLMSIHANIPFHIPDAEYTDDELLEAHDYCFKDKRVTYMDVFGGQFEKVLSRIKFLAKGLDCKVIILDHIGMLVSGEDNGDERKKLDYIADTLKKITVEYDVLLIMVSHTKRQTGKPHEEGGRVSLADLRGTAGIGQLSNLVVGFERDGQCEDVVERNTTTVRVIKNRFCGLTGPACRLFFNKDIGRLIEVTPEEPLGDGET